MEASRRIDVDILSNPLELAESVADHMVELARAAIAERGRFCVALTGGNTPRPLYEAMNHPPRRNAVDWSAVHVFFGDERSVGPDDADSNYHMAREAWLGTGPIPEANIHRMQGEADNLDTAARQYEALLRRETSGAEEAQPVLDLVLLGLGADGHVASLFPGTCALSENERSVVANEVPQLGTFRITLTFPAINAAREVWMLVAGESKAARVAQALGHASGGDLLPVSGVRPVAGVMRWWLDEAAAGQLSTGG